MGRSTIKAAHEKDARKEAQISGLMDAGRMTREQAIAVLDTRKRARNAKHSESSVAKPSGSKTHSNRRHSHKDRSTSGIDFDEPKSDEGTLNAAHQSVVGAASERHNDIDNQTPASPSSLSSVSSTSESSESNKGALLSPAAFKINNLVTIKSDGLEVPDIASPEQPAAPTLTARNQSTPDNLGTPKNTQVLSEKLSDGVLADNFNLSASNVDSKLGDGPLVISDGEKGASAEGSSSEYETDEDSNSLESNLGKEAPENNTLLGRVARMARANLTSATNTIRSHPYKVAAVVAAIGIVSIGGVSVIAGAVSAVAARTGLTRVLAPVGGLISSMLAKTGVPVLLANASAKLGLTSLYSSISAKVVSAAAQSRVMHGLFSYAGVVASYFGLTTTASKSYALASKVPYVKAGLDGAHELLTNNFLVKYAKSTFAGNQSPDLGQSNAPEFDKIKPSV